MNVLPNLHRACGRLLEVVRKEWYLCPFLPITTYRAVFNLPSVNAANYSGVGRYSASYISYWLSSQILPPKPSNKDSNDLQQQSINILGERKLINPLSQRVGHHKTPHTTPDINRQGEVSTDNGLSQPYHPDWYMTKCINDPVTDNKPLVYSTVEECCELW